MGVATAPHGLSSSLEDYLETVYRLVQERQFARVRDIASARDVKPGSVSPALKRLADLGLVTYERREYVVLTELGEIEARRIFARHQLLTRFFEELLKMPPEAAEEQACAMEHSLSNEGMDRLVRLFEFLRVCPHVPSDFLERFHACPLVHGELDRCDGGCDCVAATSAPESETQRMSLSDLEPGESGTIVRVNARGAVRQRLLDMGILPNVVVEMERVAPSGDPYWIKIQGSQLALRRQEAIAVRLVQDL